MLFRAALRGALLAEALGTPFTALIARKILPRPVVARRVVAGTVLTRPSVARALLTRALLTRALLTLFVTRALFALPLRARHVRRGRPLRYRLCDGCRRLRAPRRRGL